LVDAGDGKGENESDAALRGVLEDSRKERMALQRCVERRNAPATSSSRSKGRAVLPVELRSFVMEMEPSPSCSAEARVKIGNGPFFQPAFR
jgi:hypothetical protein